MPQQGPIVERDAASARKRWGLVLSGGAACGLANIGTLRALEERGLRPDYIAGSSMGAIVAGLYASGHGSKTATELALRLKPLKLARLSEAPLQAGLHGGLFRQRLDEYLVPLLGDSTIGDCVIPFVCVAGRVKQPLRWERVLLPDFDQHVRERVAPHIFDASTRIIDALKASSAIPVFFSPYEIDGVQYIDLCHFGAIPSRSLRETYHPEIVIGTNTLPRYEQFEAWLPANWRAFLHAGWQERDKSISACDLLIDPPLPAPLFRFDQADAFIESGYRATLDVLDAIEQLLLR